MLNTDVHKLFDSCPFTTIKWSNTIGWPIEYVSENIKLLTGYSAEDFVTEKINYFDLLENSSLSLIEKTINTAQDELKTQFQLDSYSIKHENGSTVWIEHYVTILRDEKGKVTGYIGYLLDITRRINIENNLNISRNETRALINALPDTILHISKEGELKQYISNTSALSDNSTGEVYINEIFPSDFAEKIPQYLEHAINNKTVEVYEYQKTLSDNKVQYIEARFSEKGNNDAIIILRDITSRKENEILLKQAMENVNAASRAKNIFLSNMSHELRTPLNAIMGFSQLLLLDENNNPEFSNEILSAGKHLLSLINDILDISKIEAGKINLHKESSILKEIIDECEKLVTPSANKENIQLNIQKDLPELPLFVDKTRMVQILLNILTNAIKYNVKNGSVTLSTEIINNTAVKITISDTGIGLNNDQIFSLFKPFERVGAEDTDIEGSGLGLALTKNLVELMDGEIGVESTPGKGSTFWVAFKILNSDEINTLPNT